MKKVTIFDYGPLVDSVEEIAMQFSAIKTAYLYESYNSDKEDIERFCRCFNFLCGVLENTVDKLKKLENTIATEGMSK